jgi:hypothetical protein
LPSHYQHPPTVELEIQKNAANRAAQPGGRRFNPESEGAVKRRRISGASPQMSLSEEGSSVSCIPKWRWNRSIFFPTYVKKKLNDLNTQAYDKPGGDFAARSRC